MCRKLLVILFTITLEGITTLNTDRTAVRRPESYDLNFNRGAPTITTTNFTGDLFGSKGTKSRQDYRTSDMIYPTDLDRMQSQFADSRNNNAKKQEDCPFGLCEQVEDYPTDSIYRLLKNTSNSNLHHYFQPKIPTQGYAPSIFNRNKEEEEEETLCQTKRVTIYPKKARNVRNVEKLVVNVEGHEQGVVYDQCSQEGGSCKFAELFPQGYSTSCQQKFGIRKLAVKEKDQERLDFDTFEVPSCCVCTLRKIV